MAGDEHAPDGTESPAIHTNRPQAKGNISRMRGLNYAGGTIPCPGCGRPISAVIPLTDFRCPQSQLFLELDAESEDEFDFREWWLIRELEID